MADNKPTIFQNLNRLFFGGQNSSVSNDVRTLPSTARATIGNEVLYSTKDKAEYERKLTQYKQQKLLSYQWQKAGADNALESLAGYSAVKLMYRDADLMDGMPEIGAALDILAEEACNLTSKGQMLNISSRSKRIKAILEDLFTNRLNIHVMLPMIARAMIKYGNQFMLLNVDKENGVLGWKQLPVYEIDRIENGITTSPSAGAIPTATVQIKPDETRFIWVGHNESMPYKTWQVAHFRLLNDSFFLPYGISHLHKARRAWRMWSMMEDSMLIYRLDKSIERRVFKIYVGAIDDADVPAFVNDVANNFKRTPVIDPLTGQVDLRKNFLDVSHDYFIPVRDPSAPTPIETLAGAQNHTQMDDINYMQNKVFSALRVPKTFLNFQEAQGKGQNLALLDVRMARCVNRIQQFLLMELNKVAMIHLCTLGLKEEVDNFTLSMNNPSAQIEALELEDMTKRIQTATAALADPGIGMPLMSLHMALKKIMKMTDDEIKDMMQEIRLEKAMAAELEQTQNIIKKTGIFDSVDRIYGDYDAMNKPQQAPDGEGEGGGMGGGGNSQGFDGGSLMSSSLGSDASGDIGGGEASMGMESAPAADNGTPMEAKKDDRPLLNEAYKSFTTRYLDYLAEEQKKSADLEDVYDFEEKDRIITEQVDKLLDKIDEMVGNVEEEDRADEALSGNTEDDIEASDELLGNDGTDDLLNG